MVLNNGAPNGETELVLFVWRRFRIGGIEGVAGIEFFVSQVFPNIAVERVTARLNGNIHRGTAAARPNSGSYPLVSTLNSWMASGGGLTMKSVPLRRSGERLLLSTPSSMMLLS